MKKMNTGVKSPLFYTTIISPIGPISIAFTKKGASRIALGINSNKAFVKILEEDYHRPVKRDSRGAALLKREIMTYFTWPLKKVTRRTSTPRTTLRKGRPFSFRFPIDLLEGTPFERKVWLEIKKIPYGKVLSYKDLAIMVGRPRAARAIGMACRKNPLPILIPCHRVVGKDHSLKGYSSGMNRMVYTSGIDIKKRLLKIEGVRMERSSQWDGGYHSG
jgi:O-6-methylguanine DNA methyltransferase